MYSNKEYSLEQFEENFSKSMNMGEICEYGVFRIEGEKKIPIWSSINYRNAIAAADSDCKENEGRFKNYIIEGVTWGAAKEMFKFHTTFSKDIDKYCRKNAKALIVMDNNAKKIMKKQKAKEKDDLERWAAYEEWFEEID